MAMIDYGAIAFRDGVCIQKDYFMSMKDAVGYTVDGIEGNYFSFVGDDELTFAFYRCRLSIIKDKNNQNDMEEIFFNHTHFVGWKKYANYVIVKNDFVDYEVKNLGHNSYKFTTEYKGHKYKVIFGYGIDFPYYQRTGKYNYYRSFSHKIKNFLYRLKIYR